MLALIRSVFAPVLIILGLAAAPAAVAWAAAPDGPTTVHQTAPVLGKKHLYGPHSVGFGTAHPRRIYNGGDASGDVSKISWSNWGGAVATGHGKGHQFRPGGGYYRKPVKVQFHAQHLGTCSKGGPRAYTVLRARFQKKPGSSHWTKWFKWGGLDTICTRP